MQCPIASLTFMRGLEAVLLLVCAHARNGGFLVHMGFLSDGNGCLNEELVTLGQLT